LGRIKALLVALAGSCLAGTAMAQSQTVRPGPTTPAEATQPGTPAAPVTTDIRAETAYFLAVGQRGSAPSNGPESYVVPVRGAALIAEVRQYLAERAEGREKRPLIPTVVLRLGSDGQNRNHSAPGAPFWPWHVSEVQSFSRYTWPEVEPAVFIPTRDSALSEVERYLRGDPLSLPSNVFFLRGYPIAMELRSEFPTARTATLANISDRGYVGTGNESKITGFVIEGETPRSVVVRALGPTLARFGVANALANPRLEVYRGSEKIAENDDWNTGNLNRPHVTVMPGTPPFSLIPNDDREPALELSLPPGAYTIVVTGAGGSTGVVLTEVHTL
jgi:hypothetical protein